MGHIETVVISNQSASILSYHILFIITSYYTGDSKHVKYLMAWGIDVALNGLYGAFLFRILSLLVFLFLSCCVLCCTVLYCAVERVDCWLDIQLMYFISERSYTTLNTLICDETLTRLLYFMTACDTVPSLLRTVLYVTLLHCKQSLNTLLSVSE